MTLAVQAKAGAPTFSLGGPRLPGFAPCAAEFATIYIANYVYSTLAIGQFDHYFQAIEGFRATEAFVGHRVEVKAPFSNCLAAAPCGFRRLWACVSTSSAANAFSRANCRKRASAIQSYPTTFTPLPYVRREHHHVGCRGGHTEATALPEGDTRGAKPWRIARR